MSSSSQLFDLQQGRDAIDSYRFGNHCGEFLNERLFNCTNHEEVTMRTKLINDASEKTYVLILETGEEVVSQLQRFATICKRACDVTLQDGEPKIHLHVVVGKRDGSAHADICCKRAGTH